jgi:hypothetical protein
MCRKLAILISLVLVLGLVNSASADPVYSPGLVLRCDAGSAELQAGWAEVGVGWNLDVNDINGVPTVIDVKLEAGLSASTEDRDNLAETPDGPLLAVERDYLFGNDTNIRPDNDMILTLKSLQDGFYRVFSYHHRPDEVPVPIPNVEVTGAATVLSTPGYTWQDHLIMTIPAETLFESSGGGEIVIRFWGPSTSGGAAEGSGQAYVNGFTLEYFGANNEAPYDPYPADEAEDLCTGFDLSWTAGTSATSHDIYFSTDIDEVDPNLSPSPVDTVVGSTSWTPPSVDTGTTYYWRVDEIDGGTIKGAIWRFTTNDGSAYDPAPADGWRGLPTDVNLAWSPGCDANSHNVYFGTSESAVQNGTGGTFQGNQEETTFDPGALLPSTDYYWRIDEVNEAEATTWSGEVWTFKTGSGTQEMLLHYSFDGVDGSPLPPSLPDDTASETFTKWVDSVNEPASAVDYGPSSIWGTVDSGTSADFVPNAGLWRGGMAVGTDLLILDGYQYTIECWINPDVIAGETEDRRDPGIKLVTMDGADDDGDDCIWALELSVAAGAIFVHRGGEFQRQGMFVYSGRGTIKAGEWSHVAGVFDLSDANSMKIYVDGQLKGSSARPRANPPDTNSLPVSIGFQRQDNGSYYEGMMDELRIHNYALDPSQFALVPGPDWARAPDPADKERRVDPNADLSWTAGDSADSHDVYFGTDRDDVTNATTSSDEYQGDQLVGDVNFDPGPMEYGTTYYWRIDEQGAGGPWTGMVWKFRTRSLVDDPNMLLWYPFNETSGNEAEDASGHDLVGEIDGDANWDPNDGEEGCFIFDEDQVIQVAGGALDNIYNGISIAVWLKDLDSTDENWLYDTFGEEVDIKIAVPDEDGTVYWRCGDDVDDVLVWDAPRDNVQVTRLEDWHLWVFTKDEAASEITIYFDGEDFMIFDYPLSESEVVALYRRGDVASAWRPDPRNSAVEVPRDANLGWKPGDYAEFHHVYLGTSFDDVNDADTTSAGIYKGQKTLADTTYEPPGGLALNTTYYWRIDEVNDPNLWKGNIWKFTTANYLIIDDFEDYDNSTNKIFNTWEDGNVNLTGSFIDLGVDPFNPAYGYQSMLYVYDNTILWDWDHYWSEAALPFDPTMNFTDAGVKVLTLYFYGDPDNDANDTEELYVGITGSLAEVRYTDDAGQDNNDLKLAGWTEWNIPVSDFNNPDAVDPCAVTSLLIGFGDRDNTDTVGGEGVVYFDDIRLYPPRCVPEIRPFNEDLTGPFGEKDCIINYYDVGAMADQWLRTDACLPTTLPSPGPVAHWEFEEGDSNNVSDSANSHDGVAEGAYAWVEGKIGTWAMEFSGGRVLVPDHAQLRPETAVSATAWVFISETQDESNRVVVKGADNFETYALQINGDDEASLIIRDSDPCGPTNYNVETDDIYFNEWMHLAGVCKGDTNTLNIYVNGQLAESVNDANFIEKGLTLSQDTNDLAIGDRSDATNRSFDGIVDDTRIYDRALTDAEVAWIATEGSGYWSLESPANFYNEEPAGQKAINIRDMTVLLNVWLEERFWPE